MKKLLLSTILALVLAPLSALPALANFDQCAHLFPQGKPLIRANAIEVEVCSPGGSFGTLYNKVKKNASFSIEYLTPAGIKYIKTIKRTGEESMFFEEGQIAPEHRARLSDYHGYQGVYDRGHLAPWGDLGKSTNSLVNVVPQNSHMNREPWAIIEKSVRQYALRTNNSLFIWTGVVHGPDPKTIGNGVAVPDYFYKLVYDPVADKSWAYWMANRSDARIEEVISKEELERRVGLKFF